MERLEPLDKEFYEERDTIEDIDQTSNELIVQHIIKNLDEILQGICDDEQDFLLIKEGSRKRHLRDINLSRCLLPTYEPS